MHPNLFQGQSSVKVSPALKAGGFLSAERQIQALTATACQLSATGMASRMPLPAEVHIHVDTAWICIYICSMGFCLQGIFSEAVAR